MAKSKEPDEPTEPKGSSSISLSEALLAPLSSIFEAQIHASRAFLNFFLQMGFRHKYTDEDLALLNEDREKNKEILQQIDDEKKGNKEIEELSARKLALEAKAELTDADREESVRISKRLKELKIRWGVLYQQPIEYFDQDGNERTIFIPNLSLLPIKPLAINNANFKFELKVKDDIRSVSSTIRSATGASPKRPWFLIEDPKTIEGEFVPQQESGNSTEKTIKIDVTVGAVETPYGLHKLISSLTGLAGDSEKTKV